MLQLSFTPFPELTTTRIRLRRVETTDVDEIFFLRSDERVLKYIGKEPAVSKDEVVRFIEGIHEQIASGDSILWGISLKEERQLIGTICLWNIQKQHYRGEIGYILHPDYQRKGIMQEAISAVIGYGFDRMKLHSIAAHVSPNNDGSIKLLERNGFTREGYFKEDFFFRGAFLDTAVYSLLGSS
jgi:[ribosomal protein S5]-alanine N-acetyltransferase